MIVDSRCEEFDVAIIGGGPAGSTAAAILKKYDPSLRVLILEREKFPREHVGESQLPICCNVLDEMGCWEKVEAANFPIKIGATYRWGSSTKLWDFEFIPLHLFKDEPRPAKFEGQRRYTAFQVDRAVYDTILLDHAASMGAEVRQETKVAEILHEGDRVTGLRLGDGSEVRAKYYFDGSGHVGILRRALGIGVTVPTTLKNVAMWDYWENTEWAVTIGTGGTRVQVLSIGTGWIWFIPLSPTRTSIGFICPADYYKESDKTPQELYDWALSQEPRVQALIKGASRENEVRTTKDWSFVADRVVGENWFLIGESAGFADPILAGGMGLAHTSAREAAYTVLAMMRGEHEPKWLRDEYNETQRKRVLQYIRFADFWYCANGQFTDLEDFTAKIAKDAGLKMTPQAAFRWLSLGGFNHEDRFLPGLGGLDLLSVKEITKLFTNNQDVGWEINKFNVFKVNLVGARKGTVGVMHEGKIHRVPAYIRGGQTLPLTGMYKRVIDILEKYDDAVDIHREFRNATVSGGQDGASLPVQALAPGQLFSTLEVMLLDHWVVGRVNRKKPMPFYNHNPAGNVSNFHGNTDPLTRKLESGDGQTLSVPA